MADAEIERVRAAYAARQAGGLHSSLRPDKLAEHAARNEAWGLGLGQLDHELGRVLEVGSGDGGVLRWLREVGAGSLLGLDVLRDRAVAARGAGFDVWLADGRRMPIAADSVDTVVAATLFSSVLDDSDRLAVAQEIDRVLRPDGVLLLHDLRRRNPRNRNVRPMTAHDIKELFPGWRCFRRTTTLAPPLARRLVRNPTLRAVLALLPLLRTHLTAVLVAPDRQVEARA